MLFVEPAFIFLFLPLTIIAYYATPDRFRNALLTAASALFYSLGEWRFLPWMAASIFVNYAMAIWIENTRKTAWSRHILAIGIASDLLLLIVFKYSGWLVVNANSLLSVFHAQQFPVPAILLPLGISFFTFHKISYKFDVFRGETKAQRNLLSLTLYILFFPQLIAGPIVRYHDIADQMGSRPFNATQFLSGIQRLLIGFVKKMLIANSMATIADDVFSIPREELGLTTAWLGIVCYTLQIYFDFSGYSDMAIGIARMFGFTFLENFNHPYSSRSMTEFWQRWHISLSRWFRDYLYIPMGGNRGGSRRTLFNLLTVFLLCGLWHGASWAFIIWGLFHGMCLVAERLGLKDLIRRLPRLLQHAYVMVLVMIGWVFFRAGSTRLAIGYFAALAGMGADPTPSYNAASFMRSPSTAATIMVIAIVLAFPVRQAFERRVVANLHGPWRGVALALAFAYASLLVFLFIVAISLVAANTYNPFLYFRF